MTDANHKERLEQELRFLKESYEAEVISREEYEKGSERIERKLKENSEIKSESNPLEEPQEHAEQPMQANAPQKKQIPESGPAETEHEAREARKSGGSNFYVYASVFIILSLGVFFAFVFLKGGTTVANVANVPDDKPHEFSQKDAQLKMESNMEIAKVNVSPKIGLVVLNDGKDCFNCDTRRVIDIIEGWLGGLNVREVDFATEEGKALAERINPKLLPVYILDENASGAKGFENFRQAFVRKNSSYVLSDDASGARLYFRRENIPDKIDFFALQKDDSSAKAEKNFREFLREFKGVNFEKHLKDDKLTKELGINTFPAFLVNNRIKITGVNTADAIKKSFCRMNKEESCKKNLSKSLA